MGADAFAQLKYTIFWEQNLEERRRLLRSEHIFGAGVSKSVGSIVVLPSSAQIEDAAESLDATGHEEGHEEGADAPADAEEDSGLTAGAIAGIIAGGVVVAGGIAYAACRHSSGGARANQKRGTRLLEEVRDSVQ